MELKISDAVNFSVNPSHIVTERTAVIGQSGSGKSYLVSVICEELASNDLGFVLLDTEGEYQGLSKFDNIRLIKEMEEVEDISTDEESIKRIIKNSQKIVLDVSESDKKTVNEFLTGIYSVTTELFKENKAVPFLLIVEEADIYIPQKRTGGLEILQTISRRGRKRGLGILLATQRPALVNKNVLSQCNNVFIGKLMLKNDLDSVRLFFSSMDEVKLLTSLEPGCFYVQGAISDPTFIKIRKRETLHGGSTPKIPIRVDAEKISPDSNNESNLNKFVSVDEVHRIKRAISSIKSGKYGTYIDFSDNEALKSIIDNRKKQYKFTGKYETVERVKPVMLPSFFLQIRETKKKVIGKKSNNYKVLVDSSTGNILDSKGEVSSKSVGPLLGLNQIQLQVMNFISSNKKVTMAKLKENFSAKGLNPALRKLEDAHLIGVKDGYFLSLYKTKPKSLKSQSVNNLKTVEGINQHAERLKPSMTKLQNVISQMYPDCEVMETSLIYSPFFDVVYSNGNAERILRISALCGKAR